MSFYSNQSATPLLDQVAATAAQIKYMQEQYCAVLLSEVGLQRYCDPLNSRLSTCCAARRLPTARRCPRC